MKEVEDNRNVLEFDGGERHGSQELTAKQNLVCFLSVMAFVFTVCWLVFG